MEYLIKSDRQVSGKNALALYAEMMERRAGDRWTIGTITK